MRKHQHKQILDVLKTIELAQSAKLYGDCQEGALALCDFIESIEGNDSSSAEVIAHLVEYCELLFKASNDTISEKVSCKRLIKIENCIKHKLKPDRIEIAFLSYKACMSDAIESIYLATKNNPNCDAYFIPIPYYEVDITKGKRTSIMCYEGAEFYPDYIECTNWQTYDMEKRKPDVIFTFNPFDDGNFVTSVHPDYYCQRLKNLTNMLVYIPYFLHDTNIDPQNVILSGVLNSDLVVLQSHQIREQYIHHFLQIPGVDKSMKHAFEKKVVALGSPQVDKIVNGKLEDYELPYEWMQKIPPSADVKKHIVLYNTTIGGLLENSSIIIDDFIRKLFCVFNYFKRCESAVLLWRPHPLLESTIKSMRPNILMQYREMVHAFKHEGYGIFDDSTNMHRAIMLADAYYGDYSSANVMFRITGKPILFQCYKQSALQDTTVGLHESEWLYESSGVSLDWYVKNLDSLSSKKDEWKDVWRGRFLHSDGTAGQKIFEYVISKIE